LETESDVVLDFPVKTSDVYQPHGKPRTDLCSSEGMENDEPERPRSQARAPGVLTVVVTPELIRELREMEAKRYEYKPRNAGKLDLFEAIAIMRCNWET